MDAYWLVTPEDGDRYPVGPPNLLCVSKQGVGASLLTKNEWGSIPQRTANNWGQ